MYDVFSDPWQAAVSYIHGGFIVTLPETYKFFFVSQLRTPTTKTRMTPAGTWFLLRRCSFDRSCFSHESGTLIAVKTLPWR